MNLSPHLLPSALLVLTAGVPVLAQEDSATPAAAEKPWNVVVLLADDLGYADIGVHGQEYLGTPAIDSLAEDGVRFPRAYATAALSTPSRLGLLTGRYPQRSGVEFNVQFVDPVQGVPADEETLAEMLKGAGYRTAYVGKWALGLHGDHHPMRHGFDEFFGFHRDWRRYYPRPAEEEVDARWALHRNEEIVTQEEFEHLEKELALESARKIAAFGDEPFFLVHAYNAVRGPLQLRMEFGNELRDMYRGLLSQRRTRMLAMLACLEEATDIVLGALEDAGVADRTIVVFTSDNGGRKTRGEPADNGEFRGWAGELAEGGIRVPLLVRWPGVLGEGAVYEGVVSHLDLVPTLRAACGLGTPPAKNLDGVDLAPFLTGRAEGAPHDELYFRQGFSQGAVVNADGYKLLWEDGFDSGHLYQLGDDPGEATLLDAQHPNRKKGMRAHWRSWNTEVLSPAWRHEKVEESAEAEDADAAAAESGAATGAEAGTGGAGGEDGR